MVWMRNAPLGSHIWTLGPWLVVLLGWPHQRRYVTGLGPHSTYSVLFTLYVCGGMCFLSLLEQLACKALLHIMDSPSRAISPKNCFWSWYFIKATDKQLTLPVRCLCGKCLPITQAHRVCYKDAGRGKEAELISSPSHSSSSKDNGG